MRLSFRARGCRLFLWASLAVALLFTAVGCQGQQGEPSLEEQAQEIDRSLMCPVCPSETVDQSQVQLAQQMRVFIREKLAEGWTRQQILDYFSAPERYGLSVLAAPPKRGFNLLVWVTPGVGLLAGGLAVLLVLRVMRQGRVPLAQPPGSGDLAAYMTRVDEELRQVLDGEQPHESPHPPAERPGG